MKRRRALALLIAIAAAGLMAVPGVPAARRALHERELARRATELGRRVPVDRLVEIGPEPTPAPGSAIVFDNRPVRLVPIDVELESRPECFLEALRFCCAKLSRSEIAVVQTAVVVFGDNLPHQLEWLGQWIELFASDPADPMPRQALEKLLASEDARIRFLGHELLAVLDDRRFAEPSGFSERPSVKIEANEVALENAIAPIRSSTSFSIDLGDRGDERIITTFEETPWRALLRLARDSRSQLVRGEGAGVLRFVSADLSLPHYSTDPELYSLYLFDWAGLPTIVETPPGCLSSHLTGTWRSDHTSSPVPWLTGALEARRALEAVAATFGCGVRQKDDDHLEVFQKE